VIVMVAIRRARRTFEPTDSVKDAIAFVLTRLGELDPKPEWSWDDVGKIEWEEVTIDGGPYMGAKRIFKFTGDPRKYIPGWTLGMLELRLVDSRLTVTKFTWIDDGGIHSREFEITPAVTSAPTE